MVKSICFTGHRHIAKEKLPAALAELRRVLETAIPQGFVDFYAGGALGWDTYCAQTVLDLREEYPCIALHLVLPFCRAMRTVCAVPLLPSGSPQKQTQQSASSTRRLFRRRIQSLV